MRDRPRHRRRDRREREADLARRVASALSRSWSEYWAFVESARVDRGEALTRARGLFDLAGEVQYAAPLDGWADHQLAPASKVLEMIADGYALLSVEWPDGMPLWSLPDFESAANVLEGASVARWCKKHGHRVVDLRAPAGFVPPRQGVTLQHESAAGVEIEADVGDLRDDERPAWAGFSESSQIAAVQLIEWSATYRSFIDDMARDEAQSTLGKVEEWRTTVVQVLAWLRRSIPVYQHEGAQAEAIVGLSVISAMVRSLFLAGTALDVEDYARLHVLPLEILDRSFDEYGLVDWVGGHT